MASETENKNLDNIAAKTEKKLNNSKLDDTVVGTVKTFLSMLRAAVRGQSIPVATITVIVCSLLYLICPIDLIPDIFIGGFIDDAAVIMAAAAAIKDDIEKFQTQTQRKGEHA